MTPPARAMSHSPDSRLWQARWMATRDVEHAVCTLTLGKSGLGVWISQESGDY